MLRVILTAGLIALGTSVSMAAPIVGSVSTNGTNTYTGSSVTFLAPGNVGPSTATGSFSPGYDAGCLGCVTLTGFSYSHFTKPVTVQTIVLDGITSTFVVERIASVSREDGFLDVKALGYATLTGYDTTPGEFLFSSQGGAHGAHTTFSATDMALNVPVPEPASVGLLGLGLLGLGMVRRRS